jgi:hypothetical protein
MIRWRGIPTLAWIALIAALAGAGVLREQVFGKEKLFVHPKLMNLLTRDNNSFEPYRKKGR